MSRSSVGQHPVHVTFITKPGCHLCDEARAVLDAAIEDLGSQGITVDLTERNMLDDPALIAEYQEDIPVVLIEGKRHAFWRVDPDRFTQAIKKQTSRGLLGKLTRRAKQ